MKKLIPFAIATLFVYFCFSFTMWQWNPGQWNEDKRFGFILCWIGAVTVSIPINQLIKMDKED